MADGQNALNFISVHQKSPICVLLWPRFIFLSTINEWDLETVEKFGQLKVCLSGF